MILPLVLVSLAVLNITALADLKCADCPSVGGQCSSCRDRFSLFQRPEFNSDVFQYFISVDASISGIEILALSTHGRRCAGKYNPEGLSDHSCARESSLRVSFNGALSAPSPDSAHDLLSPPPGRSHGALLVTSESGSASCAYNFSVARGLSSNAALAEITLRLQGGGITLSQAFSPPSNSTAVSGIIEWELQIEPWITSVTFDARTEAVATVSAACPPSVNCLSSGLLTISGLPVGATVVLVTVTAEDSANQLTYRITLLRPTGSCELDRLNLYRAGDPQCQNCQPMLLWSTLLSTESDTLSYVASDEVEYVQLELEAKHPGVSVEIREGSGNWRAVGLKTLTERIMLNAFSTILRIRATAADLAQCLYVLEIDRDVQLHPSLSSLTAHVVLRNGVQYVPGSESTLGRPVAVSTPSTLAAGCEVSSCMDVLLDVGETTIQIEILASSSSSSLEVHSADANIWVVEGGRGSQTEDRIVTDVQSAIGISVISLFVNTENARLQHFIFMYRTPSQDATLGTILVQGGFLTETVARGMVDGVFNIVLAAHTNTIIIEATPTYPGATITIDGQPMPAQFKFSSQLLSTAAQLNMMIVAEDGRTTRNLTLWVRCSRCGEGEESDTKPYVVSVWLVLMLLSTTLLICGLSLAVFVKTHRMRVRRRQALHGAPGTIQENPERILAAMAPFLIEVKPCDQALSDEQCAICLGELSCDGILNMLPCGHAFHSRCIRGWLVHKGLSAYCPLCKRAVQSGGAANYESMWQRTLPPSLSGPDLSSSVELARVDSTLSPEASRPPPAPGSPQLETAPMAASMHPVPNQSVHSDLEQGETAGASATSSDPDQSQTDEGICPPSLTNTPSCVRLAWEDDNLPPASPEETSHGNWASEIAFSPELGHCAPPEGAASMAMELPSLGQADMTCQQIVSPADSPSDFEVIPLPSRSRVPSPQPRRPRCTSTLASSWCSSFAKRGSSSDEQSGQ